MSGRAVVWIMCPGASVRKYTRCKKSSWLLYRRSYLNNRVEDRRDMLQTVRLLAATYQVDNPSLHNFTIPLVTPLFSLNQ